jgi:poly(beta-D-mannuronate) lyase
MSFKLTISVFVLTMLGVLSPIYAANVDSLKALQDAIAKAKPGDEIVVMDGVYKGRLTINAKGKPDKPITIRAGSRGKAQFVEPLSINGENIVLDGFYLTARGAIAISGSHIRVTRCTMSNVVGGLDQGKWVRVSAGAQQVEIDHCLFENKENNTRLDKECQLLQVMDAGRNERHHIHHNHFRNVAKGKTGNGYETIQLRAEIPRGASKGDHLKLGPSGTVVEYNLFENCNGEAELVSVKTVGDLLRYNTFRNCSGNLSLRHGKDNVVDGNYFFGSGGVVLNGTGHVVANNYFQKAGTAIIMWDGTPDLMYVRVEQVKILHNTIVNCGLGMNVGINHSDYPNAPGFEPKDCLIANNVFQQPSGTVLSFNNGEKPINWTWKNNVYQGKLGVGAINGLDAKDPKLTVINRELCVPTPSTPGVGAVKEAECDILGVKRESMTKVGAFELSTEIKTHGPLTAEDVGPNSK